MNYYNPYIFSMPTNFTMPKAGIISRIFGSNRLKLGSILNGTQRVLNFTNQLIPVFKQIQPMFKNAKTMFRVMNEFKKNDNNNHTNNNINSLNNNNLENKVDGNKNINNQGPTFFM